jgi:LacI family transcriptional regulator
MSSAVKTRTRVTQAHIARTLGISQPAVTLALRGSSEVSADLIRRVAEAAEELGYRPNTSARHMRGGRARSMTLFVDSGRMPEGLVRGVEIALQERDLELNVLDVRGRKITPTEAFKQVASDGVIINFTPFSERHEEIIACSSKFAVPCIWVNEDRETDCVRPDDRAIGRLAAKQLLELGHRRIGFACQGVLRSGWLPHYSVAERREGVVDEVRAAGGEVVFIHPPEGGTSAGFHEVVARHLSRPDRPSGLVAYEASETGAVIYAAMQCGLRVPQDLSLVAIADRDYGMHGAPIRTVTIPFGAVGRKAVAMLESKIEHPEKAIPGQRVEPSLVHAGASCLPFRN